MSTEVFLPYAPSTNALWEIARDRKTGKPRLVKTDAYKAWLTHAGYVLNTQHPDPVHGPYKITIQIRRDGSKMDVDNMKAVSDLLEEHGVVDNDNLCELFTARRVTSGYDGLVVRVEKAGQE